MIQHLRQALGEAMTVRFALNALVILVLLAGGKPTGAINPASDIRARVLEVQRVHQRDGMAGLEVDSRACWAGDGGFRCLHLDVAAGILDHNFAHAMVIGGHPYFAEEALLQRARSVFARAGWDMETSNAYLQFLDGAIRSRLVGGSAP